MGIYYYYSLYIAYYAFKDREMAETRSRASQSNPEWPRATQSCLGIPAPHFWWPSYLSQSGIKGCFPDDHVWWHYIMFGCPSFMISVLLPLCILNLYPAIYTLCDSIDIEVAGSQDTYITIHLSLAQPRAAGWELGDACEIWSMKGGSRLS